MTQNRAPDGFIERFMRAAEAHPEAIAIETEGEAASWTYGELLAHMERWRGGLTELEIATGERVVLMLPSGPDLIASFFALASLSATAVPASHRLTPFELRPILADARPVGIITTRKVLEEYAPLLADRAYLRFVLLVDAEQPVAFPEGAPRLFTRADLEWRPSALEPPRGNPVASCHFTYKGLGYPLGALHRYQDYAVCLEALRQNYPQEPGDVHLLVLPLYPVYALTTSVLAPLDFGCRLRIVPGIRHHNLVDLLERHHVRFVCLVPALFRKLVGEAYAKSGLRLHPRFELSSGGAALRPELAAQVAAATGTEPFEGYGLSETLPVVANLPGRSRRGTLGVALTSEVEVAVLDPVGRPAAPGQGGEIVVRGPTLMEGYLGRARETALFMRDGWFHTGDLGSMSADGYLEFIGRRLPLTKVMAQMVDLVEVENVLRTHPGVADARATVRIDPVLGEQVAAAVMLKKRASVRLGEILAHCRQRLSPYKIPRWLRMYSRELAAVEVDQ